MPLERQRRPPLVYTEFGATYLAQRFQNTYVLLEKPKPGDVCTRTHLNVIRAASISIHPSSNLVNWGVLEFRK